MSAPDSITLPNAVAPGETIDLSIDFSAPAAAGSYKGFWLLEDKTGKQFGLGPSSNGEIWLEVQVVVGPTRTPEPLLEPTQTSQPTVVTIPSNASPLEMPVYDFVTEICSAQWFTNNGAQPCPVYSDEVQNIVNLIASPILEDGIAANNPAIAINLANVSGSIQGMYPEYLVQPGDHLRAIASCESNSAACSALFRISYMNSSNAIVDLWAVGEFYDQKYTQIDIDLNALAGQKVKFIFDVTPLNTNPGNRVFWASPEIYRKPLPTATPTIAPTATQTATMTPSATVTATLAPTSTPTPQPEAEPQSVWETILGFFDSIFQGLFGE